MIRYANKYHEDKAAMQNSLFGNMGGNSFEVSKPKIPAVEPWGDIEKLKYEKEVVGFYISGHPLDEFAMEMKKCTPLDKVFEPDNVGREMAIGGVISNVQIRQSKNGNPFAIFKLEDYTSSTEMMLFGNDYVNFSKYLNVGMFLFIRGKTQTRWGRQDEFEFKPMSMELLSEVRQKLFKEIQLTVPIQYVNQKLIEEINQAMQKNVGNFDFKLSVYDAHEGLEILMLSRRAKVSIDNVFYKELLSIAGEDGNVVVS